MVGLVVEPLLLGIELRDELAQTDVGVCLGAVDELAQARNGTERGAGQSKAAPKLDLPLE